MFERFTDRARRVVVLAQEEARMLNHNYIGTEHILLGLIHEGDGVAARALTSLDISLDAVRLQVEEIIGRGRAATAGHIPFTPRAKKVLELALREALQLGHNYIGTEHILLGLIREGEGVAAQVLEKLGADLNRVRQTVIQLLSGYTAGKGETTPGEADIAMSAELSRQGAPTCPNCFAALDDSLAIKVVETADTPEGDEPATVKIAYCMRCGVALGTVA
jgi:ATP-dependent Clp protease ATP-binding subunit ClpC